jgi:hypothetical protein
MEKFRIAMYGMSQVTAIVYGVLSSAAAVKINGYFLDQGYPMPTSYYLARFYRDHGCTLLLLVVAWAVTVGYLSAVPGKWTIEERTITLTGIGLTVAFAVLGTILAFAGAIPPVNHL